MYMVIIITYLKKDSSCIQHLLHFQKKLHELLQKQFTLEDQIAEITNQYNEVKSTFNNILREIFC